MHKILLFAPILFLLSCSGESDSEEASVNIDETFEELQEDIIGPVWQLQGDEEYFEMEIPNQMEFMENLNPEARLKYGYIDKVDGKVMENYVIVIVEPFPEDESLRSEVDVVGFTEAYIDSLMNGRDGYQVLNEPAIETIHGLEATVHELQAPIQTANDSLVDIYYMLGVYLGEKGLYQVLSWTLMDQKDTFRSDMRHMIYSFSELGTEGASHEEHSHEDPEGHEDHEGHEH